MKRQRGTKDIGSKASDPAKTQYWSDGNGDSRQSK
jgi:hypothetical protein